MLCRLECSTASSCGSYLPTVRSGYTLSNYYTRYPLFCPTLAYKRVFTVLNVLQLRCFAVQVSWWWCRGYISQLLLPCDVPIVVCSPPSLIATIRRLQHLLTPCSNLSIHCCLYRRPIMRIIYWSVKGRHRGGIIPLQRNLLCVLAERIFQPIWAKSRMHAPCYAAVHLITW